MKRTILLLLFVPMLLVAQSLPPGRIIGKVVDAETGEIIIGANVTVEGGARGAASDVEGRYSISLPPGTYTIAVSALSHAKARFTGVVVEAGKDRRLDAAMTPEAIRMNEVVVEAKINSSYEAAMLRKQKNSVVISDAISAEQIKRTPDATSGDAIRRLTGISLVDNKFVFVRGVTDRYNQTTLNGTTVSSTDADKKSFSFDILPSSLLDNTVVVKSATPDMRGDFTGGLVQLSTLDFPDKRVMKVGVSSSVNSLTTGKSFFSSTGGSLDWLGIDNGNRKLPDAADLNDLAQKLPNTWKPRQLQAPLNTSFSLSYGDNLPVEGKDGGLSEIGFIGAVTYRNGFQHSERVLNDFALGRYNFGGRDEFSVLWGALANLSYKTGAHKIGLKNNYNQTATDQVGTFTSLDRNTSLENSYTVIDWNERSVYSGQLSGEHSFPSMNGAILEWRGAVSSSTRTVPDRKQVTYFRPIDDPSVPFSVAINQRSWSQLDDHTGSLGFDVQIPLTSTSRVKVGGLYEGKKTDYRIRYFNVVPDYFGGISNVLTTEGLGQVYESGNFGAGKFLLEESSKASDSYTGTSTLTAAYAMADVQFSVGGEQFRFVGGGRLEDSRELVRIPKSLIAGGPADETALNNTDLLPSANLTYLVNSSTNLRVTYSHSVNRPEFRELASTGFYDFIKYEMVGGNPDLRRALAQNFDVRLEMFPDLGEVLAVSFFHKQIKDAIEEKLIQAATRTRTWFNSDDASNLGWEFEVRKSFGFIHDIGKMFSVTGNYTRIKSSVEVDQTLGNSSSTQIVKATRPMQGQSPYIVNLSILFSEPSLGTSVNILYNKFGRRLDAVGFLAADVYEEPRELIDIAVTQPALWGLELKLTAKNINNSEHILTRDGLLYEKIKTGLTYSLQISKTI